MEVFMKFSDIILEVSQETSVKRPDVSTVLKSGLKAIANAVNSGDVVNIKDVGRFRLSKVNDDGTSMIIFKSAAADAAEDD
jgi:nucleoid DNA-binding protein